MRTILALSKMRAFQAAVEAALGGGRYQVVCKDNLRAAEPLLARGAVDAIVMEVELTGIQAIRQVEQAQQAAPGVPLYLVCEERNWEWEEDAFLLGVAHVITKPLRGKLLQNLLARALEPGMRPEPPEFDMANLGKTSAVTSQYSGGPGHFPALEALRRFSGLLTQSLQPQALLREFLLLLREVIGVNRAVVFLRNPVSVAGTAAPGQEDRWLRSACAIGLEQSFLEHFALSLTSGIGAHLRRQGRILKDTNPEVQGSREMLREFQMVGGRVAIPILDRETLLGVALLDERLTGEAYANEELSLLFHMLEEVGLAIRNSWLHDQLQTSHAMLTDILGSLGTACVVVGSNLGILHVNGSARTLLLAGRADKAELEFSDLPQELGSKVFTVLKTGYAVPSYRDVLPGQPGQSFQIAITPFKTQHAAGADAALLVIENITHIETARRLEIEASNLRLINAMAQHLAHEIGNSLVPLSTHQQLLEAGVGLDNEEFRGSLVEALGSGVKRITRLSNQMMFLARDQTDFGESIAVRELIDEAFRDASLYQPGTMPTVEIAKDAEKLTVTGDHKALRHAFSEVLLNALQANPGAGQKISVSVRRGGTNGSAGLNVEVRDAGPGFTAESARRAPEPFFSTRNVGLGLGLTVTRKIIEDHRGNLEIGPEATNGAGVVRIVLPVRQQS